MIIAVLLRKFSLRYLPNSDCSIRPKCVIFGHFTLNCVHHGVRYAEDYQGYAIQKEAWRTHCWWNLCFEADFKIYSRLDRDVWEFTWMPFEGFLSTTALCLIRHLTRTTDCGETRCSFYQPWELESIDQLIHWRRMLARPEISPTYTKRAIRQVRVSWYGDVW